MTGHDWRYCEVCSETKHWYLLSSLRNVWWTLPLHRTGQVLMWSIEISVLDGSPSCLSLVVLPETAPLLSVGEMFYNLICRYHQANLKRVLRIVGNLYLGRCIA